MSSRYGRPMVCDEDNYGVEKSASILRKFALEPEVSDDSSNIWALRKFANLRAVIEQLFSALV